MHLKALAGIGDTDANLRAAAAGEGDEWTNMYPSMAKEARDEGFDEIARVLACQESARLRGIDLKKNLVRGVVKSSLGQLAIELAEKHDRVVAFG